jgi:FkbM family methyltransferase
MKELVFDVGMHNGQDSMYYLKSGYRVVGVEANPMLCKYVSSIGVDYVDKGDLIVENVGISNVSGGSLRFYLNESRSEWSSFDYNASHKKNSRVQEIDVFTRTLEDLIIEYGMPYYLKVDIEAYDSVCLESLFKFQERPRFVSCEANSSENLKILFDLGYRNFKLINQSWFHRSMDLDLERKRFFPLISILINIIRKRLSFLGLEKYPVGSSGPFGDDAYGPWINFEEAKVQLESFYTEDGPINGQSWFDIHAKY